MFAGLGLPLLALLMAAGMLLDRLFGEVPRWHPLVGFGRYASWLERLLNAGACRFVRGGCAWAMAVLPPVALVAVACLLAGSWVAAAIHVVLLYFCLGLRSLRDHMQPIGEALLRGDIAGARELTSRIVSRDTAQAEASDLAKAAVESMLENGNDAVFGTLFWFLVAGGPGALLFRLANTLDAMWGYRTPRFDAFGCAAARIDDALNWVPARLTALSYAVFGDARLAWTCWRTQACRNWPGWPSSTRSSTTPTARAGTSCRRSTARCTAWTTV